MRRQIILTVLFFLCAISFYGQDSIIIEKPKKLTVDGYVSNMQSAIFQDINKTWVKDNLFHNRINIHWYPNSKISGSIEFRNRLLYGDQFITPGSSDGYDIDPGIIDASWNIADGESYLLNTMVDRANIKYTLKKSEITIGRQRINWGQTFAWNPNDIFNTYSFFDFDYGERPGSDALLYRHYSGLAASQELAVKLDSGQRITAAGLVKFNKWRYDFQLMGGILNEEDYVAGIGWTGNISKAAFRGEISYFHPMENAEDTSGLIFATLGGDYTFNNSLYIQIEFLYNQMLKGASFNSFNDFYSAPLSVKNLSFTEYNFFANASYPFTPLLNGSISAMYYPAFKGYYAGPSLSYSLRDDLEFSVYTQIFSGEFKQQINNVSIKQRLNFNLAFVRLRWNF